MRKLETELIKPASQPTSLLKETNELISILFKSVETAKKEEEGAIATPWTLDIPCWILDIQKVNRR